MFPWTVSGVGRAQIWDMPVLFRVGEGRGKADVQFRLRQVNPFAGK
jgi:hypothetical protein